MTKLVLIAAVAENGVIGIDNDLPFRLSTDLKRFKKLTLGKPIIMGRKTYESIGKPLPKRTNIVVTRDPDYRPEGVEVYDDLEVAIERGRVVAQASGVEEVCVIGGGEIYKQTIDLADLLYITHVKFEAVGKVPPEGDAHFPPIDPAHWESLERIDQPAGEKDEADMVFMTYAKRD